MSRALALALVLAASPACRARDTTATAPQPLITAERPTLVYLVRHAEKALDQGDDPALTEAGQARAAALDALLAHAGVTHLFSTQYQRTALTLAPLAARAHLSVTAVHAKDSAAQLSALRALPPGSVAVVAGHSNTVPGLVRELGGAVDDLTDAQYDRLYVVALARTGTTTRGTASVLRYGAPSPD